MADKLILFKEDWTVKVFKKSGSYLLRDVTFSAVLRMSPFSTNRHGTGVLTAIDGRHSGYLSFPYPCLTVSNLHMAASVCSSRV